MADVKKKFEELKHEIITEIKEEIENFEEKIGIHHKKEEMPASTQTSTKVMPEENKPPEDDSAAKQAALESFISTTTDDKYRAVLDAGRELIDVIRPPKHKKEES